MAITKQARDMLGAKVIGHDDLGPAVMTETGMLKTSRGLIAPQSTERNDTRSGAQDIQDQEEDTPAVQTVQPQTEQPAVKRKGQKRRVETVDHPVQKVEITISGFGSLPTQYTHVFIGTGIVVLGINEFSFIPEPATMDDGKQTHVVSMDIVPGRSYIYGGNRFTDAAGINNIVLVEVQKEE